MKPVGYTYLNQYYRLLLPKLGLEIYQDPSALTESIVTFGASKRKVLSGRRKITDSPYEHMILAIKLQGIRLHFFAAIFSKIDIAEFTDYILNKPQSKYNRVLWYLYEWLTDNKLAISDLKTGNYEKLFDSQFYYTLKNGERDTRTRIENNAIGSNHFCPTIRKVPEVVALEEVDVYETAYAHMQSIGRDLPADAIGRSINYLYTKETKSSTEIEREKPSRKKMNRFLNTIKNAGLFELTKEQLLNIQNQIVEEKRKNTDYRKEEIYVGTTIQRLGGTDEDVHYIGPLAKHVEGMMSGLLETHDKLMIDCSIPALMHAAVISFGEVYIHPMSDGNGRIHRYLIHDVMKHRESDHEFIIPISAAILRNEKKYDDVLDVISKPIMAMLDWELDHENAVIIHKDLDYMYRFPDFTEHVKFVYEMMNTAIGEDLFYEICLLIVFDGVKKIINQLTDIPNNKLDTLVSILVQNGGQVSKKKKGYVLKYIDEDVLQSVEEEAVELISEVKEKYQIDVVSIINLSK